ncbi:hypothetical protein BDV95DRAFT_503776, partial [Massariosphaeria phaeospora]
KNYITRIIKNRISNTTNLQKNIRLAKKPQLKTLEIKKLQLATLTTKLAITNRNNTRYCKLSNNAKELLKLASLQNESTITREAELS